MTEQSASFPLDHPRRHRSTIDKALDNHFHAMIEELHRIETRITDNVSCLCSEVECRVAEGEQKTEACLVSLEMAQSETEAAQVDLQRQFGELKLEINRLKPGILGGHESASSTLHLHHADGLDGHRVEHQPWDRDYGTNFAHTHILTNGMNHTASPHLDVDRASNFPHSNRTTPDLMHASQGRLPKIQFPMFTGEDPQLWRSGCENYFDMYGVEQQLWVRVASMHLEGPTAHWLPSTERQLRHAGWDRFCVMVHDRFGHDQHEVLIR
jgi:hypothetical protein